MPRRTNKYFRPKGGILPREKEARITREGLKSARKLQEWRPVHARPVKLELTPLARQKLKAVLAGIEKEFKERGTVSRPDMNWNVNISVRSGSPHFKQRPITNIVQDIMPFLPAKALRMLYTRKKFPPNVRKMAGALLKDLDWKGRHSTEKETIKMFKEKPRGGPGWDKKVYMPYKAVEEFFTPEVLQELHRKGIPVETLNEWTKKPFLVEEALLASRKKVTP